jgi:geranylgeranyl diphosphate synthase, type II
MRGTNKGMSKQSQLSVLYWQDLIQKAAAVIVLLLMNKTSSDFANETEHLLISMLAHYRSLVMAAIKELIANKKFRGALAHQLIEYPIREGKGLRPALCLATCQAYGGHQDAALNSAVALELFHNAFLVHDDIEDESDYRRKKPTLNHIYGTAVAVNIGDALNVLSMTPLLDNLEVVGVEKTLRVFQEIELMARESVEGQAMELEWLKSNRWELSERDYYLMTRKKTAWYTCITPCRIGAILSGHRHINLDFFTRFGFHMGIAFQIQDDLLNLVGEEERYGKESCGDIWEGKRTVMLISLIQRSSAAERNKIIRILSKPRLDKTETEVAYIFNLMGKHGCLKHGSWVSKQFASKASRLLEQHLVKLPDTPHKQFLREVVDYVVYRDL